MSPDGHFSFLRWVFVLSMITLCCYKKPPVRFKQSDDLNYLIRSHSSIGFGVAKVIKIIPFTKYIGQKVLFLILIMTPHSLKALIIPFFISNKFKVEHANSIAKIRIFIVSSKSFRYFLRISCHRSARPSRVRNCDSKRDNRTLALLRPSSGLHSVQGTFLNAKNN